MKILKKIAAILIVAVTMVSFISCNKDDKEASAQLSDKRVESPAKVVKLNQHVRVRVMSVDLDRQRIALTMKAVKQP